MPDRLTNALGGCMPSSYCKARVLSWLSVGLRIAEKPAQQLMSTRPFENTFLYEYNIGYLTVLLRQPLVPQGPLSRHIDPVYQERCPKNQRLPLCPPNASSSSSLHPIPPNASRAVSRVPSITPPRLQIKPTDIHPLLRKVSV